MTRYFLLLKKQIVDFLPTHSRKKTMSLIAKMMFSVVIMAAMVAIFALVFSRFTKTYTAIKINRVPDISARQYELLSLGYFVLIAAFVLSGVSSLSHEIFENSDLNILITMPFNGTEIFLSKLTWIYLKQVLLAIVCVFTLNITFISVVGELQFADFVSAFLVALFIPVIPLGVASIIVLPFHYVKKLINSQYLLSFVTITAIAGVACWGFSYVFEVAQNLFTSGKITSLFNENVMNFIISFTAHNYPANLFASLIMKRDVAKNIGLLVGMSLVAAAICFFVVRSIFVRVTQANLSLRVPHARRKKAHFRKRSGFGALIAKEFLLVMRTPSYAYMYLTTAVIMPILAFYSAQAAEKMVGGLLGELDLSFEICTFVIVLYSMLTNTFCSTNISRDGYMSMTQKTMPFSPSTILGAKITFCAVVAELSLAVASALLAITHMESWKEAALTFVCSSMFAIAQIVTATKLDLSRPRFSRTEDGEIKENTSTVLIIIIIGLVASFLLGFGMLFSAFAPLFGGEYTDVNKTQSYLIALGAPFVLLCASLVYFFVRLKQNYLNLDAEV